MKQKKNPSRFTIQFDISNPCHQKTIKILNSKGRNIAGFISEAVLSFDSSTNNIENTVKNIVTQFLAEQPIEQTSISEDTTDFDYSEIANDLECFK